MPAYEENASARFSVAKADASPRASDNPTSQHDRVHGMTLGGRDTFQLSRDASRHAVGPKPNLTRMRSREPLQAHATYVQHEQAAITDPAERKLEIRWRRRESNPGPRGIRSTFVHVRSRHCPDGASLQIRLQPSFPCFLGHGTGSAYVTQP